MIVCLVRYPLWFWMLVPVAALSGNDAYLRKTPQVISICGRGYQGVRPQLSQGPDREPRARVLIQMGSSSRSPNTASASTGIGLPIEQSSMEDDFLATARQMSPGFRPKNRLSEDQIVDQLARLGWGNPIFLTGRGDIGAFIVDQGIRAPISRYGYHGTSTSNYESILKSGLDNRRGREIHSGGAMGASTVTYSGDARYAADFARTAAIENKSREMLLRFEIMPFKDGNRIYKSTIGALDRPVESRFLEYSLDQGKTWIPYGSRAP